VNEFREARYGVLREGVFSADPPAGKAGIPYRPMQDGSVDRTDRTVGERLYHRPRVTLLDGGFATRVGRLPGKPAAKGEALPAWGIFRDGKTTILRNRGQHLGPGATRFFGTTPGGNNLGICVSGFDPEGRPSCYRVGQQFPVLHILAIGGHAAEGVEPTQKGALIIHVSQTAAVEGGVVHVWGTGFGDKAGKLRIGDTEVAPSAIVDWADNKVAFRVTSAITEGRVRIDGPAGFVTGGRTYHLRRTGPITTPFSDVEIPVVPLKQGITKLPLKPYEPVLSKIGKHFVDGDDLYLYAPATAEEPTTKAIQVNIDDWLGQFIAATSPGMVDAHPYTLALNDATAPQGGTPRQLEVVGDRLMDIAHGNGWERRTDGQVQGANFGILSPSKGGKSYTPRMHREPDGTFLMVLQAPGGPPVLVHASGWGSDGKVMNVAGGIGRTLDWGLSGVAKLGDLLVVVGDGQNGGGGKFSAGWRLSTDAGKTLANLQADKAHKTLTWPVAVGHGAGKGIWALELETQSTSGSPMRFGVDGKPQWEQAPAPFTQLKSPMLWSSGAILMAWQPADGLQLLDTAAAVGERKWQKISLPAGDELVNVTMDWPGKRVLLVAEDSVYAAPLPTTSATLAIQELAKPSLIAPIDIRLRSVGAFADGSLLCDAELRDGRKGHEGKPSPLFGVVVQVKAP
ncbi:MAG: hypothetical protein KC502_20760, partial [Myxococcales bacterium]|nr:hypothetical protein [Myxococcales bacterium]